MNYENVLPAINKLSHSLSEEMCPDIACTFATRIAKAVLQRDKESIEQANRYLQALPILAPPVRLGEIPGLEPLRTDEGFQAARQQGVVVMCEKFLGKLPGPTPLGKLRPLVEQTASEIESNPRYAEKRSVDIGYKEGIQAAKNKIILFLNHLPASLLA